jgi:TRAP-type mannitol/chloroaromatic compound transport system permease large subunit
MSPEVMGLVLLGLLFVVILLGFPISFTLIFLGMVFGYIGLGDRVFHLMTYQVFGTMVDTVLAAVAMFTFMGYILESAGLMNRLFHSCSSLRARARLALSRDDLHRDALRRGTGIVGASVTIIALMAAPAMLKSKIRRAPVGGHHLRRRHARHPHPAQRDAGGDGPTLSVSVARLYAGALLPGLLLSGLYPRLHDGPRAHEPKLGPPLSAKELDVPGRTSPASSSWASCRRRR